jgi:hypothetical protein
VGRADDGQETNPTQGEAMTPPILIVRAAGDGVVFEYPENFEAYLHAKRGRAAEWLRTLRNHADAFEKVYAELIASDEGKR